MAQPRYWTTLVGLFALVGLILGAVGIYGVVSGVLLLVALAACHGPARRATRVDPIRALSSE